MKHWCFAALLGVTACSDSLPDDELGTAADPQVAYSISGVRLSPVSVHFTGLPWLLNSAEAAGPIVLTTHVATFVLPTMTSTVNKLPPGVVSSAVNYSLSQRHDLYAVSTASVSEFHISRLEAYASFEETLWNVADPSSGALLGTGASFKPSGVFFQTVQAAHAALPDMGLFTFIPGCENLDCPPLPGSEGEADAGTGTAGSRAPGFLPLAVPPLLSAIGGEGGVVPRR